MYLKPRRKYTACPNCDTVLSANDNYCPNCGQENHHLNVPFHHLVGEFIESIFHIDTKFWETIKSLFIPGKLTNEFVAGRRARYMPPARLYIMMSFVFFIIINYSLKSDLKNVSNQEINDVNIIAGDDLTIGGKEINYRMSDIIVGEIHDSLAKKILLLNQLDTNALNIDSLKRDMEKKVESLYGIETEQDSTHYFTYEQLVALKNSQNIDSLLRVFLGKESASDLNRELFKKILVRSEDSRLNISVDKNVLDVLTYVPDSTLQTFRNTSENKVLDSIIQSYDLKPSFVTRIAFRKYYDYKHFNYKRDYSLILNQFTKYLSYVMFILMPFVALILLVLNYRWKRYYYEYLIFSIHTHTVLFFFAALESIVRYLLKSDSLLPEYSLLGMFFYTLFALKNVYKQSWKKTILKFFIISFIYCLIFSIVLLIIFLYSAISF